MIIRYVKGSIPFCRTNINRNWGKMSVYRESYDCSSIEIITTPKQLTYHEQKQLKEQAILKEKQQEAFYLEAQRKARRQDEILHSIFAPIEIAFIVIGLLCPAYLTYRESNKKIAPCMASHKAVCK